MKTKLIVAVAIIAFCSSGTRGQVETGHAPYQQNGSGNGPSRNGVLGNYNLAYTQNGVKCGLFTNGPCDPDWVIQLNGVVYNGTITDSHSQVFFCQHLNYLSTQQFDEFDLCFHANVTLCIFQAGCGNGVRYGAWYWHRDVELDHIYGNSNLETLWFVTLTGEPINGTAIPYSGYLHLHPHMNQIWSSCQTYYVSVGYSPDNVTWNNYTTGNYTCVGTPGPTAGFLAATDNVANSWATFNIPSWTANENPGYVQTLYDTDINQITVSGQWCDWDNGAFSCVLNGTT